MAAWALGLLLLASGIDADLQRALVRSGADLDGLSVVVGRAGAAPLFSIAADAARVPASNQKILTATAALHLLGRDFRFETVIARKGEDLVVIGDGDPNLSGRFFGGDAAVVLRRMAADLRKQGVMRVRDLVVDASRFDREYVHPDWPKDQLERWYCAPVSALVYNDSCWDVTVKPGVGVGSAVQVVVLPALLEPPVLNRCTTVAAGAKTSIQMGRAARGLEVRGRTNHPFSGHIAVRDPVTFFGRAFSAALREEGIAVAGRLRVGRLPGAKPVVVYRSTLRRSLPVMLTNSQNLYAECLFKRLADGSFGGGSRALLAALQELGIETGGVRPRDGSGMSHRNRLTARSLYGCLQAMRDEPSFVQALATGGTGTLRRRYKTLGDRLRAKTGSIRGVSALSGFVSGHSGQRYVFVVLANGASVRRARRLQDLLVRALADA